MRARRDPKTRKQLLAQAKVLLKAARAGDHDAAEVLLDVLGYLAPQRAEALALALRGYAHEPRVAMLSPSAAAQNLATTLYFTERILFPPREKPCMPNRKAFRSLVESSHGSRYTRAPELGVERTTTLLWDAIRRACDSGQLRVIEHALEVANLHLGGHGVEGLQLDFRRGPTRSFDYVNMGDTYAATLIYDNHAKRFHVTSYGDMVETLERRYGRAEDD